MIVFVDMNSALVVDAIGLYEKNEKTYVSYLLLPCNSFVSSV